MAGIAQMLAGTWVLGSLDDAAGGVVRCHVSVQVAEPGELSASELDVQLLIGGSPMSVMEAPADGPLPCFTITGTTAYGQYSFYNPGDPEPEQLAVTLGGETAFFDLTPPIV